TSATWVSVGQVLRRGHEELGPAELDGQQVVASPDGDAAVGAGGDEGQAVGGPPVVRADLAGSLDEGVAMTEAPVIVEGHHGGDAAGPGAVEHSRAEPDEVVAMDGGRRELGGEGGARAVKGG